MGRREEPQLPKPAERIQGVSGPNLLDRFSAEHLDGLHEKFDLANPPDAQLDVAALLPAIRHFGVDHVLDGFHIGDDLGRLRFPRRRRPFAVDERTRGPEKSLPDLGIAGHGAGLEQRQALPALPALRIVVSVVSHRAAEPAGCALGAEAQIHSKNVALLARLSQGPRQGARHELEIFFVGDGPEKSGGLARQLLGVALIGPMHENQVDVRTIVQLAAAELPHAHDHKAVPDRFAAASRRHGRAILLLQLCFHRLECQLNEHRGEV